MSKITVTKEHIDEILKNSSVKVTTIEEKTTIVSAKLPNGFVIVESSSCVDPENYNEDIGYGICMERIRSKLWELEGYRLQCAVEFSATNDEDRSYHSHPPLVYDSTKCGWPPPAVTYEDSNPVYAQMCGRAVRPEVPQNITPSCPNDEESFERLLSPT